MGMGNSSFTIVGLMIFIGASMSAPQSSDLSGAPELGSETEETRFDVQTQIYILSGTFGGILFLLIILVLGLALAFAKLKTQLKGRQDKYGVTSSSSRDSSDHGAHPSKNSGSPEGNNHHHTSSINAYVNSAFIGNSHEMEERRTEPRADLSRLGYEVYQGNRPNSQENNSRASSSTPKQEAKATKEKKYVSRTEIVRRGNSSEEGGIAMSHMSAGDVFRYGGRTKWTPRPSSSDNHQKKNSKLYEYVDYSPREEFKKPSLRASSQIPRARSKDDRVYALDLDDSVAPKSTSPEKGGYRRSEGRRNRY